MLQDTTVLSKQARQMLSGEGIVAALDQSGGSIPRALRLYGVTIGSHNSEQEMIDEINAMRSRIISSPAFVAEKVIGAIIFRQNMHNEIDGKPLPQALWEDRGIVPFVKIDDGLEQRNEDVQLLKPIADMKSRLRVAADFGCFGTKKRSVIYKANPAGINMLVAQQFELGSEIMASGLVPIIEPEVDKDSRSKIEAENILRDQLYAQLNSLGEDQHVLLKLSIPTLDGFYDDLTTHPRVLRVMGLSGGYSKQEACARLARQDKMIASFSRALVEGLNKQQSDSEFNATLATSIDQCRQASI